MSPIIEEERTLVAADGHQGAVMVSKVAPGRYRIEDFWGYCVWSEEGGPEDAGIGWTLEVDELADGRLRVKSLAPDPDVESVSGFLLPTDFMNSVIFERLTGRIDEAEGNWEVFAGSVFSGYVSRSAAEAAGFTLRSALEEALAEWEVDPGERSDGAYLHTVTRSWALRRPSTPEAG